MEATQLWIELEDVPVRVSTAMAKRVGRIDTLRLFDISMMEEEELSHRFGEDGIEWLKSLLAMAELELDTVHDLQTWANANKPGDEMRWKNSFWGQIIFVRDSIGRLLGVEKGEVKVVGEHWSKSIRCPVFELDTEWATITMRYNYFDWNINVVSKVGPLEYIKDLEGGYDYCFMQGMAEKFPPYTEENTEKFTAYVGYHYMLFALLWQLQRSAINLKSIEPVVEAANG